MQHYMIKFISDLRQVGGFLWVLQFSRPVTTYHHDIAEILLKVALNTTTLTLSHTSFYKWNTLSINKIQ